MRNGFNTLYALMLAPLLSMPGMAQAVELSVVHGIPGSDIGAEQSLPVDISLNGACVLPAVTFGDILGPLEVPAGLYTVGISLANEAAPCEGPLAIATNTSVSLGENATIVAHLTTDGTITATKYTNDVRAVVTGDARAIVRHVADAPTVDIIVSSGTLSPSKLITDLENPEQAKTEIQAGTYDATITAAGDTTPVAGPVSATLESDKAYIVYAVGSLASGSFTLLLQAIDL